MAHHKIEMELQKTEINNTGGVVPIVSKRTSLIRTLTANDVTFWGADAFISVALALFVVSFIDGATILNVGIALMIHRVTGAVTAIPAGQIFDKYKGYIDEVWGLTLACLASGFLYVILSFADSIWQLYVAMFFLGMFSVINIASWRILFYSHINEGQLGQTIGMYQMLFSFGIGLFLAIGGFAGDRFGYDSVLMFGGLIMIFGSVLPFMMRGYLTEKERTGV